MSTILKDSEVSAAAPGALPGDSAGKPQPVALEVSVSVNGARTVDGSDKREPFSEATKTVLVFGNGAVIRLQSSVAPGQLLFLTNEKTKKEVVCQVVKSKNYRNVSGYVELEFTEAVVGFWGMRFPGDRVAPAGAPVAAIPATNSSGPISSPNKPAVPAQTIAAPPAAAQPTVNAPLASSVQEIKPATPAAVKPPLPPAIIATSKPATVTPITPFSLKADGTTSSSRAATSSSALPSAAVISLPRAPQSKAPVIAVPAAPPAAPVTSADNSAEALRAENARLQEQLSALLFAGGKKNKTGDLPTGEPSVADIAAKISEVAEIAVPSKLQAAEVRPAQVTSAPVAATPIVATPIVATPIAATPIVAAPIVAAPVAPAVVAIPAKPGKLPADSLKSFMDDQEVKVPSWLEPLARNAAVAAPAEEESGDVAALPAALLAGYSDASELLEESASTGTSGHEEAFANVPAPNFGGGLSLGETAGSADSASGSSKKGLLIGIAAAVLLAAGGGYWYTQQGAVVPAGPGTAQSASANPQPAEPVAGVAQAAQATANVAQRPGLAQSGGAANNGRAAGAIVDQAATPAPINANLAVQPGRAGSTVPPVAAAVQPAAAPAKRAQLGDVHLAAPTVSHKDGAAVSDEDPGLNGGTPEATESLGANFVSTSGPAVPTVPVPVGGVVKAAQLLKTIPPVYPAFAKTQRVGGDVKIDALIDATGHVTTMKVVAGPAVLHQAAMDALRQWKYQPATLDGKAVPVHLNVTIQFKLQ
jgi:protein TonB